jgi:hypothetical protein
VLRELELLATEVREQNVLYVVVSLERREREEESKRQGRDAADTVSDASGGV